MEIDWQSGNATKKATRVMKYVSTHSTTLTLCWTVVHDQADFWRTWMKGKRFSIQILKFKVVLQL